MSALLYETSIHEIPKPQLFRFADNYVQTVIEGLTKVRVSLYDIYYGIYYVMSGENNERNKFPCFTGMAFCLFD